MAQAFRIDGALVAEHDRRQYEKTCNAAGIAINLRHTFKGQDPADCFVVVGQLKGRKIIAHRGDGIITCWWCGRTLENSLSRIRGVGPICIGEYGPMPGRDHIEDQLSGIYQLYRVQCKAQKKRPLGIKRWLAELSDDEFKKYWQSFAEQVDPGSPAPRHFSRPAPEPIQVDLGGQVIHPVLVEI